MLALTFLVLFLGNFLTTLKVVRQKVQKNQEKVEKTDWVSKTVATKQGTEDFFFHFKQRANISFCQQPAQSLDGTDCLIWLKGKCGRHFSRASTAAAAASCCRKFFFFFSNQLFKDSFTLLLAPSRATVCCFYHVHRRKERVKSSFFSPTPPPFTAVCQYMNLSAGRGANHMQLKVRGGQRQAAVLIIRADTHFAF